MLISKNVVGLLLLCAIPAMLVLPVAATTDYNVGVTANSYIKYGNATTSGPVTLLDIGWLEYQVTGVSGKNVTLVQTGTTKNGAISPDNGTIYTCDIERGTINEIDAPSGPVIGANLNAGDLVSTSKYEISVNRTESRTYFNLTRPVNVVEEKSQSEIAVLETTIVYDKATGVMLELHLQRTDAEGVSAGSFNVIETDILTGSPIPEFPASAGLLAVLVIAAASIAFIKVSKKISKTGIA